MSQQERDDIENQVKDYFLIWEHQVNRNPEVAQKAQDRINELVRRYAKGLGFAIPDARWLLWQRLEIDLRRVPQDTPARFAGHAPLRGAFSG